MFAPLSAYPEKYEPGPNQRNCGRKEEGGNRLNDDRRGINMTDPRFRGAVFDGILEFLTEV